MQTFPVCPRCSHDWIKEEQTFWDCPICGMSYNPSKNCMNLLLEDFLVYWFPEENISYLYCYPSSLSLKRIKLPFLPYDITLDKLKLYLTFL